MTRRALLIGAETYGLQGVYHDIATMTTALEKRDFTVERCVGLDATRDGIIEFYGTLIADTRAGDVALVYYSGHGGYAWPVDSEAVGALDPHRQFIVPTDFGRSTAGDFRGITTPELSVLLGQLTTKTDNVVVLLDCCHSATMCRQTGHAAVRRLPEVVRADVQAHHRRRVAAGLRVDLASPAGSTTAVRLVAADGQGFAHELVRADGYGTYGVFTRALVQALDEAAGTRVNWSWVYARVRHLVWELVPHQRPGVEGPAEGVANTGTPATVNSRYALTRFLGTASGRRYSGSDNVLFGVTRLRPARRIDWR